MTLTFDTGGRLTGRAGCNNYVGRYTLTGESLTISTSSVTLKACAPSLMQHEDQFIGVLKAVQRFEISPTGALVLHTADGRTLTARKE